MSTTVKQKDGRKYHVESGGITSLKRDYMVIQDATMGADGEVAVVEMVPQIPGQIGMDGGEQERPKVLKFREA